MAGNRDGQGWWRRLGGAAVALLLALAVLVQGYGLAAVIGSAIPANPEWREAQAGVRIYVVDNGVHTDLVLPAAEWRDLVRPGDIARPIFAGHSHMMFGWGDRDFYLNTPTWWDLDPWRGARALFGGAPTVLHVAHVPEPAAAPHIRAVMLRPDEYRRLAAHVRATFAVGPDGRAPSVRGYAGYDAFYAARGGYSARDTCNEWTGRGLRAAGVRMGVWTPFPFGVMQWL